MGDKGLFWNCKSVSVQPPACEMEARGGGGCPCGSQARGVLCHAGLAGVADGEHLKEPLLQPRGGLGGCCISEEDPEGLRLGGRRGR